MAETPRRPALPKPCPAALGAFGVPARRWATRADLFGQLEKGRQFLSEAPCGTTLADAAMESGLSEFHFARLFRETYGESPAQFHRLSLIHRAQTLLKSMSVSEVADELGYQSVSSFIRAYRRQSGATPGSAKRTSPSPKGN